MRAPIAVLALALLLPAGGCASSSSTRDSAQAGSRTKKKRARTTRSRAKAKAKKSLRGLPQHVKFTVESADLKTEVLPLFAKQAGIVMLWYGEPRTVSLRLSEPVHWEVAMDLICRFTRTHLTEDYRKRMILKNGWGGDLYGGQGGTITARRGTPNVGGGGGGRAVAGTTGAGSRGSGTKGGSVSTWGNTYGEARGSAGKTAQGLLRGTTTRHSGSR